MREAECPRGRTATHARPEAGREPCLDRASSRGPGVLLRACGAGWRRAAVALALALPFAAGAAAGRLALDDVMTLLGHRASGQATFTEQRWVHGLDAPLTASGTLSFTAPDRFERRTLQPRPETMVVQGNELTLTRGGRSRTLALDAAPEAQVAVEALRGALTGDAAVLRKYYRAQVAGDADRWTVDLVPRDGVSAGPLLAVRLSGRRGELLTVETTLAGGDHNVMSIEPAASSPAPAR